MNVDRNDGSQSIVQIKYILNIVQIKYYILYMCNILYTI